MKHVLGVLLLVFSVEAMFAGGFQIPLQGQKQAGMASIGTAMADDASVLFYNPGGLSFTKHSQISASAWLVFPNIQFMQEGTNQLYTIKKSPLVPFTFYASYSPKATDNWKVGVGVYTPYGAIIEWPSAWGGQYVLQHANLTMINIQPTFSYKIANKVGIGAGFVYSLGSVDLVRGVPLQDTSGVTGSAELKGKASAYGFNVGIYYDISKKFSIGASYHHKLTYSPKKGTAHFSVPNALKDSFPDNTISTNLTIPYSLNGGITYRPTPKVTMSFDVNYVGWSAFDDIKIHFAKTNTVVTDIDLPRHFKNSFTFRLGGQYAINRMVTIRGGTFVDLTPVPDGYVPPEIPDANKFGGSLGMTASFGHFSMDVSLAYVESLARQESQAQNYANLGGIYKSNGVVVGVGINYSFYKEPKKDK